MTSADLGVYCLLGYLLFLNVLGTYDDVRRINRKG